MTWTVITQAFKTQNGAPSSTHITSMYSSPDSKIALQGARDRFNTAASNENSTFVKVIALIKGDHLTSTVV